MPLILAIEPDRRQASQLTAMVRGRLHAELVLGESAERALAALGGRVPDLVLTSALLSPRDEAALGERLRALDGVAAHVQTLTIPVLASSSGRGGGRASGMLSALRREKTPVVSNGCDPGVFAEQCKEYLERAGADRAAAAEEAQHVKPVKPIVAVKDPPAAPPVTREVVADPVPTTPPAAVVLAAVPEAPSVEPPPSDWIDEPIEPIEPPPIQPSAPRKAAAPRRIGRRLGKALGLTKDDAAGPASLLAAVAALEAEEQVRVEPIVVPRVSGAPASEPIIDPAGQEPNAAGDAIATATSSDQESDDDFLDLSGMFDTTQTGSARRASNVDDEPEVDVYEIDETLLTAPVDDTLLVKRTAPQPGGTSESAPQAENASPAENGPQEWMDIIEALRRDAEQMQVKPPVKNSAEPTEAQAASGGYADDGTPNADAAGNTDATDSDAAANGDAATNGDAAGKKKRKRGKGSPAQDEWGFFDPDQCGFAALIEKLEEITDKDDTPTPRRA